MCKFCKIEKTIFSENQTKTQMMDLNTAAVAGNMNVGAGYSQLETLTSALEIPSMSQFMYNKHHTILCNGYEKAMKDATKEETELAISLENVDVDGTPLLTVIADGSWCKRLYKTMYKCITHYPER